MQFFLASEDPEVDALEAEVIEAPGRPRVVPSSVYDRYAPVHRATVAKRHGLYGLPTTELVDWLRVRLGDRHAIEIGAGHGVLAATLGIPATDNCMQRDLDIAAHYALLQQPVVTYGRNVVALPAREAVALFRPQVTLACWVTHRYDPSRPASGGNQYGVDERAVIEWCEEYVVIGNETVHAGKPIWSLPHERFTFPWLKSRAMNGSPDFIAIWRRDALR